MSNLHDPLTAFGASLHAARNGRHWTVEQLAIKSGVSESAITDFEAGSTEAALLDVVALAKAPGPAPQELFAGASL